jgi:mannose-6-phosphate isomerase-like protein (cupin superfamily)
MKRILFFFLLLLPGLMFAQNQQNTDTINAPATAENVYNKPLYSDSLSSSFLIIVKKEVKLHKHESHSEQVYVIAGEADMVLGDKTIHIRAGDVVFIPKGTPHSARVTSKEPLKILSVQAPYFDGKDRVLLGK